MKIYLYSIARTFLQGGAPILINLILGNFLTPAAYGEYTALHLLALTLAAIMAVPADSATIHYIVINKDKKEHSMYYSAGWLMTFINAILIFLFFILFEGRIKNIFNIKNIDKTTYFVSAATSLSVVFYAFYSKMMTIRFLFKEQIFILAASLTAQCLVICYLLATRQARAGTLLLSSVFYYVVSIYLCNLFLRKEFRLKLTTAMINHLKSIFLFSITIYLGMLAGFIDEKIDFLCINKMLSKEKLAYYSYAMMFGSVLYGIGLGVSQVTFPLFCQFFRENALENCALLYQRVIRYLFLATSFSGLLLLYNSKFIVNLLLPPEYAAILPALSILIPGMTLFASFAGVGTLLTAAGKPKYGLYLVVPFAALNLILNIILIPIYDISGAAIATSITFITRSFLSHKINENILKMKININKVLHWYALIMFLSVIHNYDDSYTICKNIFLAIFLIFLTRSIVTKKERAWFVNLSLGSNVKL